MGKQDGIFRFQGSVGGVSFYHDKQHGFLVRGKGGADSKRIKKDASFERFRENSGEFGMASRAGKLIRQALRSGFSFYSDKTITQRLTSCLLRIKDLDTLSVRGQRKVSAGLAEEEGRKLLSSLDFTSGIRLHQVLSAPIQSDMNSGTLLIQAFDPLEHLKAPKAATHVRFKALRTVVDFEGQRFQNYGSPAIDVSLNAAPSDVLLQFGNGVVPGTELVFLGVLFLQEINGELYELEEGSCVSSIDG